MCVCVCWREGGVKGEGEVWPGRGVRSELGHRNSIGLETGWKMSYISCAYWEWGLDSLVSLGFLNQFKKVKVSHSLIQPYEQWWLESHLSWAQQMKDRAYSYPFAALCFPYSKKYSFTAGLTESFRDVAWRSPASNSHPSATFCTITKPL